MQKDDGNPSGGERRPESDERSADSGKREAQGRRPRRGTRRTDGPLGKHESKNTKKMIAAQAIDPAKDIAASRERMAWEDARAKRAADARVDAAAGAGAGTGAAAGAAGAAGAGAAGAGASGTAGTKAVVAVDHVAAARERAASGAQTARERATSAGEWAAAHRRLWIVLAVVVAVAAALYGPAQRYYVSMRTTQDLQVKYAALKSQNKDLKSDVDTLMSKEGIEDQARKNGYVYPGEKGVEVKGLKEDGKDPSAAITYKDDRAWYTKVLDVLFGYDRKTVLK